MAWHTQEYIAVQVSFLSYIILEFLNFENRSLHENSFID